MDISFIQQIAGNYWQYVLAVIGIASILAAFVPAPKEDASILYKALYRILQWCSVNVGKAKNANDVKQTDTSTTEK